MDGGAQDSVMAEIALALAMGFFSVMVLTMVSMGAGEGQVAPTATPDRLTLTTPGGSGEGGRFFDAELRPVDPARLAPRPGQVLAVEPGLAMEEALALRKRISVPDLTVTTLDGRWLDRLKALAP